LKAKARLQWLVFFLVLMGFGLRAPAMASTTFDLHGYNFADQVSATVDFDYDPDSGIIHLTITNSSDYDARLTGFAFNLPDSVYGISAFTGPYGWSYLFKPGNINTPGQFGQFDLAGITGPNFNGGFPNDSIPPNDTFAFAFTLEGMGLDALLENSFLQLFSYANKNGTPQPFIARFQRVGPFGEDSDVAVVPIPAPILLLGGGLLGLFGLRRRFGK
jgi:hypothetical protein